MDLRSIRAMLAAALSTLTASHALAQASIVLQCTLSRAQDSAPETLWLRIGPGEWRDFDSMTLEWGDNLCQRLVCTFSDRAYVLEGHFVSGLQRTVINRVTGAYSWTAHATDGRAYSKTGSCGPGADPAANLRPRF